MCLFYDRLEMMATLFFGQVMRRFGQLMRLCGDIGFRQLRRLADFFWTVNAFCGFCLDIQCVLTFGNCKETSDHQGEVKLSFPSPIK